MTEPHSHFDSSDSASLSRRTSHDEPSRAVPQSHRPRSASNRLYAAREEMCIDSASFREFWGTKLLKQHLFWNEVSAWSRSVLKRVFDCFCVLTAIPVLAPVILLVGAAVRLTSRGPVFFLQERVGRNGRIFTIFKFRTMIDAADSEHPLITTSDNLQFTPIGPFLRQWKLDELPQLANVLLGHMSLVGPRPKLPEHTISHIPCRPGITGMATIVFASEEAALARIPADLLNAYYQSVVLPAKFQLDIEYMARATFFSDLGLLANSILHRWNDAAMEGILFPGEIEYENQRRPSRRIHPPRAIASNLVPGSSNSPVDVEQPSAL